MMEANIAREYAFVRCAETPGGASQSSASTSDASSTQIPDFSSLSEQRAHAQRARQLPSRTLAVLSKLKNGKNGNVASAIGYRTIRVPSGGGHLPIEEHAKNIASHMELHEDLMQDDPISEMLRIETIREMPQSLTVKRSIRAKLAVSVNRKAKKKSLGYWKRLKYTTSISLMKIRVATNEICSSIELWYHAIRTIEGHFGSGVATYFKFLRWLFILNVVSFILSTCFVTVPQSLVEVSENSDLRPWDIFIGNGYLENTIMYYGFYGNETIEVVPGYTYNIPSAYFLTLVACYVFTFVSLSVKVARSYRKCYIETSGGIHNLYVSKIFCGWDFGVSSYKAANLCSASVYRELKELLAEANELARPRFLKRLGTLFCQCAMTIVVMSLMAACGAFLWILLIKHEARESDPWSLLLVPFVITCIMNLFPAVVSLLVKFELYSNKRTALYVTMFRVYATTAMVISTLLFYWLYYSTHDCWQTDLAQELYRLVILDFVISIVGNFVVQAVHHLLHRFFPRKVSAPKFQIATNTLNLLYNQILFWVAFYFSPPLSLVIVVKMIMTFHVKKFGLVRHCEPSSTSWRAAQTQTLFLALAFLAMTAILVTLGYVMTSVKSGGCGPFRDHDYTWEVVIDRVLNLRRDSNFWIVVTNLATPAIGAAILIAMSMTVYYLRAKAQARKALVRILREMLVLQSRDKDFLLKEFSKVADETRKKYAKHVDLLKKRPRMRIQLPKGTCLDQESLIEDWLRRRANFDLQRETSSALPDHMEMVKLSKRANRSGRQAAGDSSSSESPSTSRHRKYI